MTCPGCSIHIQPPAPLSFSRLSSLPQDVLNRNRKSTAGAILPGVLGGIIAMVIGSMMLIKASIPELRPSLRIIIPVALGISLILIFLVYLVIRAHARRSLTGKEGMVGEIGTARTDLGTEGKVFVHGELWEAEAVEPVRAGEKVRIVEVLGTLKIRVKKA